MTRHTDGRAARWAQVFRTPMGVVSAVLLLVVVVTAVLAPLLWGDQAAEVHPNAILEGASADHPLGTDAVGRDNFLRLLVATRLSVVLALLATAVGVGTGVLLGTAPSVLPRWSGRLITAGVNIAVAFPGLLLVLFFAVVFGVSTTGAVFAIGLSMAPGFARLTQSLATSIAGRDYIAAARLAGANRLQLLWRHILPNIGEPLLIQATIVAGGAVVAFAGLSFLGIGVQAPSYDWGRILSEGLDQIYVSPAAALGPALAVVVAGLAFNLFGESAASVLGGRTSGAAAVGPAPTTANRSDEPGDSSSDESILVVDNLRVSFPSRGGWLTPVRGVSFDVRAGEAVGIVGESGSGKSLTALATSGLIESPGVVTAERLDFAGVPLLTTSERELRPLLGTSLAMVFQDPTTSFNPTQRVGRQLAEVAELHQGLGRRAALAKAVDRLRAVRVPAAERRARDHPHVFSGGMRQRAMIGMGLMGTPRLVIADEPTTALDVTVQRQVLELLDRVRKDTHAALVMISHDLLTVAQTCDRVLVMYAGRIVEDLPAADLESARHPYTRLLLSVTPDFDTDRDAPLAVIPGEPCGPEQVPAGCAFAERCPLASARCLEEDPSLTRAGAEHRVACWHPVLDAVPDARQGVASPDPRQEIAR